MRRVMIVVKCVAFIVALLPLYLDLFLLGVGIYIGTFTDQPPDHGGAYLMVSGLMFIPSFVWAGVGSAVAFYIPVPPMVQVPSQEIENENV